MFVSGHVQGVFFRQETQRLAEAWGVRGWVHNMDDGRVEAVFEGDAGVVEKIVEWAHKGPRRAWVTSVEVEWEEPLGEQGFRVR